MKVTCQACSAQYTIADEKVKGRKVKIRCKACQTPIVVDGQNPAAQAAGSGNSEPPPSLDPFAPESAIAADADVWNVNLSDTDSRTMTTAEVIEAFRSGVVTNDAFVWRDGMADWLPIMECVELAPLLSGPTAPPAPVAGQTPLAPAVQAKVGGVPNLAASGAGSGAAARTASAKAQVAADLFGNLDAAGSEDIDVSLGNRGLPVLPGSTAYDDKPTGQRNENSVLFSLDAMKAGFSPSAAKPEKTSKPSAPKPGARPAQASSPDDPFGMSGGALAGQSGNPIFSLNANQALLTAPAPPEPKPVPVPVPVASAPGSLPPGVMDEKTKQLVMFGGLGAGAIIMLLLALVIFGGSKSSNAEGAKAALSAQAETAKDDKKDEKKAEQPEAKAEEKKDETEATKPAASEEKKPEETAKAEPGKAETPKSSGHATAATPKKEEPAAPGPSTAPPFSKASAISALGAASGAAGSCKKGGGPTGVGKVQVTFAPSGRVTSATVMGPPFAGTAVGGCVANVFRRAKVPAFSGNAVTVSKSFAIN